LAEDIAQRPVSPRRLPCLSGSGLHPASWPSPARSSERRSDRATLGSGACTQASRPHHPRRPASSIRGEVLPTTLQGPARAAGLGTGVSGTQRRKKARARAGSAKLRTGTAAAETPAPQARVFTFSSQADAAGDSGASPSVVRTPLPLPLTSISLAVRKPNGHIRPRRGAAGWQTQTSWFLFSQLPSCFHTVSMGVRRGAAGKRVAGRVQVAWMQGLQGRRAELAPCVSRERERMQGCGAADPGAAHDAARESLATQRAHRVEPVAARLSPLAGDNRAQFCGNFSAAARHSFSWALPAAAAWPRVAPMTVCTELLGARVPHRQPARGVCGARPGRGAARRETLPPRARGWRAVAHAGGWMDGVVDREAVGVAGVMGIWTPRLIAPSVLPVPVSLTRPPRTSPWHAHTPRSSCMMAASPSAL
jgi:hypothetical protein